MDLSPITYLPLAPRKIPDTKIPPCAWRAQKGRTLVVAPQLQSPRVNAHGETCSMPGKDLRHAMCLNETEGRGCRHPQCGPLPLCCPGDS